MHSPRTVPSSVDCPDAKLPRVLLPAPSSLAHARWCERQRPLLTYSPLLLALDVQALALDPRPVHVAVLLVAAGLLSWGLFEYCVHRFVLHRTRPLFGRRLGIAAVHGEHHRNPNALQLHNSMARSFPVGALYALLAWAATGSWFDAAYLLSGFTAAYLCYEWIDQQAHRGAPRFFLLRLARRYHLQHHHVDPTARYGLTSPLFDLLFGTFQLRTSRRADARRGDRS